MKNLFKNLMLVAVAAMAFTACSEDNNEVNNVERVTRYEFTAEIADDTRSGFVEKEDGATAYKSEWAGNETLKIFVTDYNGYYVETTAKIDVEGKFTLELENAPANLFMKVCSPAESWTGENSVNIPAVQNPTALSVDPMAHILATTGFVTVQNGVADKITMAHNDAAYGKMTVNGVDFAIDHVVIDLKGSFYDSPRELSYTINAANVEGNTFWFATEPIDVAELTVTAYDAEGKAVTKTVNMVGKEKPLAFSYGKVSTFSVSELKEPAAPIFTGAAWTNTDDANDKLIQFFSNELGTLQLNFYKCGSDNCIDARTYGFALSGDIYPGGQFSWYKPVGATEALEVIKGSVDVTVVDGQYHFEFKGLTDYSGSYSLTSSFTGEIAGLDLPDTRTPLALPTNVTATADGNIITISWDPVVGADEYYVFCYEGGLEAITTAETSVTIEAAYSTKYSFLIRALANESNPNYRTNENDEVYFNVTTGKDPNSFADYELDYVTVGSNYFEFNRDWNNGSANTKTSLRIYLNSSDKGSNYINPGHYNCLGQGASTPSSAGSVNLRYCTDTWQYYYSTANSSSYLDVEIVDGQYVIIATIDGKTWGYKGLPGGWIIPDVDDSGEGGDSGDSGEGDSTDPETPLGSVTINSVDFSNPKSPSFNDGLLTFEMYYTGYVMDGTYNLTTNTENSYINRSIYNVKVNGQPATTVSGAVKVTYGNDYYVVYTFDNVVINGITFTGSAKKYY